MPEAADFPPAEVKVRRYSGSANCDVIVSFRGQEMALSCRDYAQAVKWARLECRAYKLPDTFAVERIDS
jgi:hypothetical protein